MKEIRGTYNTAKVFTDSVEELAEEQIRSLCNMEIFQDSVIRIMPDVHAGAGCTIGTTMTIRDALIPNLVGVDIGCGMETVRLSEKEIDLEKLDVLIHEEIPSGMCVRRTAHPYAEQIDLSELKCSKSNKINIDRAYRSIGTLGGGNHFIEVDKDEEGNLYLVIHSGSRHLGLEVANYYQEKAYRQLNGNDETDVRALIEEYKRYGRQKEIESALKALKQQKLSRVPYELAYCTGELFEDYIHDMRIVQRFAVLKRKAMTDVILKGMSLGVAEEFTTIHNYIDTENMILRKGAVSAQKGEKLLIPINMRDGSLICVGKGNEDWNCSAPHGAGRILSRNAAKRQFTVEEYLRSMEGIYTTSVSFDTLDECPMAYKPMEEIISNIEPTVDIVNVIKPIYNFKAGE